MHATRVEEVLLKNLKVDEAHVVGVSDDEKRERVVACLVMKKGEPNCSLDEVREACRELGKINHPTEIRHFSAEEIPRSPIGKVLKRLLVEMVTKNPV